MATLTETAYYSRQAIKYGSIGLVVLLILRSLFLTFQAYWKKTHPPPPPPPTFAFGKLPKLKFPARENIPQLTFKIETISGTLPKLADQAKVFFMPQPSPSFLSWDKSKTWARGLGFTQEPEEIEKFTLQFVSETTPKTTLNVNVLTRNFQLSYDWRNDLSILSESTPPTESQAISQALGFLQNNGVLTENLSNGRTEVIYLKYSQENLAKALFFSEANFARVNLFRQDIKGIKAMPPNPQESNVMILLSSAKDTAKNIVEVKYINFPVSQERFATYSLKDTTTVWNQLTSGKGFIANLGNNPSGKITLRDAYLAYYDSNEPQNFLQPVIVFEGDNDFFAYVPAVTDSWVEQ